MTERVRDADESGLPPGAVLPDADRYRRHQLWALLATNLAGLIAALAWGLVDTAHPRILVACVAALTLCCGVSLLRWLRGR